MLSQVAATGLPVNTFTLFLHGWSSDLHVPVSRLLLCFAGTSVAAAIISPFAGALADKYPARWLFAFGLFGTVLLFLAISFATAYWQLLILYGLFLPLANIFATVIPSNALISRWFVRHRGLALGLSAFGIGLGGVILPPIIGALLPSLGWRMIWRYGALLVAAIIIPFVLYVARNQPDEAEGAPFLLSGDEVTDADQSTTATSQLSWRAILARRNFWLLLAIYFPMLALYGGAQQNLGPFAASRGLGTQAAGEVLSIMGLAHLAGTIAFGMLSDRFGNRLPFAGLGITMAVGTAILSVAAGFPSFALGYLLIGLGGGLFTLISAGLAAEFGAEGVGRAYGLTMFLSPVLAPIGYFIARIKETTGSYAPALLGMGLAVSIGTCLILLLRERSKDQPATLDIGQVMVDLV